MVDQVLADFEKAPIDEKLKALFRYIEKVNANAADVKADDIARVKRAGWSDEAIYDALSVAALFKFFNTWIDGSGVEDMSRADYKLSGERLATMGYIMAPNFAWLKQVREKILSRKA